MGFGLFLTGVVFAYAAVLPRVLEFFTSYDSGMGITNEWRIGEYISFATQFVLIFGLAFELPVVVMTFVMIGLLNYSTMVKSRSYAVVAIVVVAAIITPTPDAMTLLLLAGPMYFLYELCIVLSWFVEKRQKKKDAAEAEEEEARLAKYVGVVEAEERAVRGEITVTSPSHLIEYGPEEEDAEQDSDPASLEGDGEALDPQAEADQAGEREEGQEDFPNGPPKEE